MAPVCAFYVLPPLKVIVQRDRMIWRRKDDAASVQIFRRGTGKVFSGWSFFRDGDITCRFDERRELRVGDVRFIHEKAIHVDSVDGPRVSGGLHADHVHVRSDPARPWKIRRQESRPCLRVRLPGAGVGFGTVGRNPALEIDKRMPSVRDGLPMDQVHSTAAHTTRAASNENFVVGVIDFGLDFARRFLLMILGFYLSASACSVDWLPGVVKAVLFLADS